MRTSPPATSSAPTPASVFAPGLRMLTLGLLCSVGIVAFDGLGVTTALPVIAAELGGVGTYGWAISALMLASAIGTVLGGAAADQRGPRLPLLAGFLIFAFGLTTSAAAPAWPVFLLGRVAQGLGVGALLSLAYVVVATDYPRRLQARALALISAAWTVPALIGPLIASALTALASWRLLFLGLLPIVLAACLLTARALSTARDLSDTRPEVPVGESGPEVPVGESGPEASVGQAGPEAPAGKGGGVLSQPIAGVGLAASAAVVLIGLEQRSPIWLAALTLPAAVLMVLALRAVTPAGTLRLARGVPAGVAARGILSMAFFGIETFLPLALTALRGAGLITAGLAVSAGALVWVAGSLVESRHEMRAGAGTRSTDAVTGLLLLAAGIGVIAATVLSDVLPVWMAVIGWAIGGFGMGLAHNATTSATFSAAAPDEIGQMSGSIQMAQTLGTALIAGLGTAVISRLTGIGSVSLGIAAVCALTALCALAAIPVALRIRRR